MKIVITGSIATDHLMVYPGRFTEALVGEQLENVSLSFLVDDLAIHRGGAGANIAFNLGRVGLTPMLVGAAGHDFPEYGQWLASNGVDISGVHTSDTRYTARFLCTTDQDQNQIATFYAGAMTEARTIELAPHVERLGGVDVVLVGPNDPVAMLRHTDECRDRGYPFAADPSQQLALMEGGEIRQLVEGATYLFTNDYERRLLEQKTGWSSADVQQRVEVSVRTHGANGVTVQRTGAPEVFVKPPQEVSKADPTGVGDAFRAGYLAGQAWGVGDERAAQVGCMLATLVIETVGPQEYTFDVGELVDRLAEAYGPDTAADVAAHLDPGKRN